MNAGASNAEEDAKIGRCPACVVAFAVAADLVIGRLEQVLEYSGVLGLCELSNCNREATEVKRTFSDLLSLERGAIV